MPDYQKPSYYAVLPATVRYDAELPPNAKLLYAEISSLCDAKGYCFASNKYFAQNFELDATTIQRLIKALSDRGYVRVEVERDPKTNAVVQRRIYAGINPAWNLAPPSPQKCGDPPQNHGDPSPQKCGVDQYKCINNTPHTPQGGQGGGRKRKALRSAPDWNPERFESFWKFYRTHGPKGRSESRAEAAKEWDKLQPDDALIATMARALSIQVKGEEWRRGVGVPHACRWLRNRRWEDDLTTSSAEPEPEGLMVEDRGTPIWS